MKISEVENLKVSSQALRASPFSPESGDTDECFVDLMGCETTKIYQNTHYTV